MVDQSHTKPELRELLRQRRNALRPSQQRAAAESLVDHATQLPTWAEAQHIALYLAMDGEIDTRPLESALRERQTQLYLPVITVNGNLQFSRWDTGVMLVENRYGIPEPPPMTPGCDPSRLDIIFMPLVGWDKFGHRLGMGGGFYDRALFNAGATVLVGLAHECQRVEELPRDSWDVSLNYIATDTALYRCRGNG